MKSMTTQIERRFEISSLVVGLIDGSFEIGMQVNFLLLAWLGPTSNANSCLALWFLAQVWSVCTYGQIDTLPFKP